MSNLSLFQTERLLVRQLSSDDFDDMFAVYSDPEAMRWVDDGQPITQDECRYWIGVTQKNYETRGYGMSAIVLRATGKVIGFCGIVHPSGQEVAEIKYALLQAHWGKGYATEMARAMIDYGYREYGLREMIATIAPDNLASQKVMAKVGMIHAETIDNEDGTFTELFRWKADE